MSELHRSKIMECILNARLLAYVEQNDLFNDRQGFYAKNFENDQLKILHIL